MSMNSIGMQIPFFGCSTSDRENPSLCGNGLVFHGFRKVRDNYEKNNQGL